MKLGDFINCFGDEYFNQILFNGESYQFIHDDKKEITIKKDHLQNLMFGEVKNIKALLQKDKARIDFCNYGNTQKISSFFENERGGDVRIYCYNPYEIGEILKTINPLLENYEIDSLMFDSKSKIEEYKVFLNGEELKSDNLKDIAKEIESNFGKVHRLKTKKNKGLGVELSLYGRFVAMDEKKCEKDLLALFISTNKKDNENKNKQKRKIESKVNEVYDTINGIDSYSDWDRKRELGYNDDEDKLNEKIIRREEKKLILERKREEKRRESRLGTLLLKREKKNLYDYLVGENKKEDKEEDKEEKNLKNIANNVFVDEVDVDEIRNKKMNIWCKMSPVDKEFAKLRAKDLYKKGIIEESSYSDLFEYYLNEDKKNLCENVKIVESEMARKNKKFVIEGESKNSNS